MSTMTLDEARAEAARVIAEHDAAYGSNSEQWQAEQRACQERKAEREKQKQVEKDRVAAQNQQVVQQQNTDAYWQGHAEFCYDCIRKYFEKNFHVFFDPRYAAYSEAEAKHLVKVLGEVVANLRREWTGLVGKRTAELTTREQTNKANEKFNERINALEREVATLKGELNSARDMAGQFRSLEQSLAARQLALLEAQRGPKGLKGDKGERGAQGARGERGPAGPAREKLEIAAWRLADEGYRATPLMSDGSDGATLDVQPLLQKFITRDLPYILANEVAEQLQAQRRAMP